MIPLHFAREDPHYPPVPTPHYSVVYFSNFRCFHVPKQMHLWPVCCKQINPGSTSVFFDNLLQLIGRVQLSLSVGSLSKVLKNTIPTAIPNGTNENVI